MFILMSFFLLFRGLFSRKPKRFVLLQYRSGEVKEGRILDETDTHYLISSERGVVGATALLNDWTPKSHPAILEVYVR